MLAVQCNARPERHVNLCAAAVRWVLGVRRVTAVCEVLVQHVIDTDMVHTADLCIDL